ncbi:alpha-L-rhamnosidase [Spirosoma fluviale]|uniref:Alpha-L-rhamnosidase n=2 Tax=Spirosoma fluviale TaxID=1597977 RepID=A0A286GB12_9BACT|nr:alpha-L-rhamnosidase [Spirosoma fluviale]
MIVAVILMRSFLDVGRLDALVTNFQNLSNSARPRVWWHWVNGNVTKDGISSTPGNVNPLK